MGGADVIPGVSGGTFALIMGIYERLVRAISHFDTRLVRHLKSNEWKAAAEHIDLRFLISLGIGILSGALLVASLVHHLLIHHWQLTFASFYGMILASCWIVGKMVQNWSPARILLMSLSAIATYFLIGLPFLTEPPSGKAYLFLSGMIAISAMILPGISGAFILLLLGKYTDITAIIRQVTKGNISTEALLTLGIFATGCFVGLISFCKLLRWLLKHYHQGTLAVLCGIMIGALRKLWPFKIDLTPKEEDLKLKRFQDILPESIDSRVLLVVAIAIGSCLLILLLDKLSLAQSMEQHEETASESREQTEL